MIASYLHSIVCLPVVCQRDKETRRLYVHSFLRKGKLTIVRHIFINLEVARSGLIECIPSILQIFSLCELSVESPPGLSEPLISSFDFKVLFFSLAHLIAGVT